MRRYVQRRQNGGEQHFSGGDIGVQEIIYPECFQGLL
jgi:hypothetical protein